MADGSWCKVGKRASISASDSSNDALTRIHILGCDADTVIVVKQRGVAVVGDDVVLQHDTSTGQWLSHYEQLMLVVI